MHRRSFVTGVAVVTGGLAGCLGDNDDSSIDTSGPEAVVESWHREVVDISTDELESLTEAAYHSQAPFLVAMQESDGDGQGEFTGELDVESIETEVLERGLGASALQEALGFQDTPDDETLDEIASNEETARVEDTVELSLDGQSSTSTEVHIVVTENDEWQILHDVPSQPES